ncbi:unnamed protein product [Adineta steineri]|uniref:Uncharacterized protein n=1 Tax=Adineta steineri TaxID=433720 RepID=A0A818G7E3_9BILA|nr:unnamed protein product [Adineta steineri]CAF1397015.1 unnamed protein product [Adineta steineri]CAF3485054.1 unnamed protein product [Adineta steineri]CAF3777908.1 unnamed protein product [Adineta steineri]
MINATHMCQIPTGKRESANSNSCYYCQQEAFHSPYVQHNSSMINDVSALVDRIHTLTDSMTTISITTMRSSLCNQLQQWREDNVNHINKIYKQKLAELNAKIVHLDTMLNQLKNEKQQEISQVRMKIGELVNVGGPTSEQMTRLRKVVDQIAVDLDKLRSSTIRIEILPTNLDTCRVVYMDPSLNIQQEGVTASVSKTRINDDVKYFSKPTNHCRPTPSKPMQTMKNLRQASSAPIIDATAGSHLFHSPGPPPTVQPHILKTQPVSDPPHTTFKPSHIPMPPPLHEASQIPMPPPVPEASYSPKECHSPTPSELSELLPPRSPEIPMPPPIHESSHIPMPPPLNKSPSSSGTPNIPMPPPIPKTSNIPMPPPVTTPTTVPLRTIRRYGKHQVMFE